MSTYIYLENLQNEFSGYSENGKVPIHEIIRRDNWVHLLDAGAWIVEKDNDCFVFKIDNNEEGECSGNIYFFSNTTGNNINIEEIIPMYDEREIGSFRFAPYCEIRLDS